MTRLHIVLPKVSGNSSITSSSQKGQHQPWEKSFYFYPKHSLQDASGMQLGVSQPICVVAVTGLLGVQGRRSTSSSSIWSHCK